MSRPIIFCVDDEKIVLDSLKSELKEAFGSNYSIETADNVKDAMEIFHEFLDNELEIPVVIADYIMPYMKGDELLKYIHTLSPKTHKIMLTGQATIQGVINAVNDANLYRYIGKPWVGVDLILTITEAIKSFYQEKNLGIKKEELERQNQLLNQKINELNKTTIEKKRIEQEAEKLSNNLSNMQKSLKDNLLIRRTLHSLVNMLQIQIANNRKENLILKKINDHILKLDSINEFIKSLCSTGNKEIWDDIKNILLNNLHDYRVKIDSNINMTMIGYIKAIQNAVRGITTKFISKPTNLSEIFFTVKKKYSEILENNETTINFTLEMHQPEIEIRILDFYLINIIENLLTNSIRKVSDNHKTEKWIKIVTDEIIKDGKAFIKINWMDNGPGVIKSRKETIFEGDSDKTEEGDHGIGLKDLKIIIEGLGGFIKEIGIYRKGANFEILFPKIKYPDHKKELKENNNYKNLKIDPAHKNAKILIADDDEEIINSYIEVFNEVGFTIIKKAYNGKMALDIILIENYIPDLLITDIEMKIMDGYSLIKKINENNLKIPILVISGIFSNENNDDYKKLIKLNKLGITDLINKPVNFEDLLKKTLQILQTRVI